jgi:hypothetical protein
MTCTKSGNPPVPIVSVELQFNCLPDKSVYMARYSREDLGVLDFNVPHLIQ